MMFRDSKQIQKNHPLRKAVALQQEGLSSLITIIPLPLDGGEFL
ncbi:hypothetical protein HCCG_00096 [Helicobacter cinaedi CCUG 18818 = ATCC BAA-847]|uniref:Transposase n=1 Tax=Helicobacter cinaedi CCUG 18818 = ATCC BAA-847 TaxID=537971 RepID=A0ABN0B7X1_9HELI|nr:hypothetical protein HCCG_00096 [Helicobacter cinaedi CCUG 18818 = ATCC BAA-847]